MPAGPTPDRSHYNLSPTQRGGLLNQIAAPSGDRDMGKGVWYCALNGAGSLTPWGIQGSRSHSLPTCNHESDIPPNLAGDTGPPLVSVENQVAIARTTVTDLVIPTTSPLEANIHEIQANQAAIMEQLSGLKRERAEDVENAAKEHAATTERFTCMDLERAADREVTQSNTDMLAAFVKAAAVSAAAQEEQTQLLRALVKGRESTPSASAPATIGSSASPPAVTRRSKSKEKEPATPALSK